jgi:hypothetical protein
VGLDDIDRRMILCPVNYKRHRFAPEIIAHVVWLLFRFPFKPIRNAALPQPPSLNSLRR